MAGSALIPAVLRKAPTRTEWCLMLEAVPWENPTYGISGGLLETWSRAELRRNPPCNRKGRAGNPLPKDARASAPPDNFITLLRRMGYGPYGDSPLGWAV